MDKKQEQVPRAWKYNPLVEITLARIREFVREPEAVFWVFVFPVLLALALGIAFRHKPPDRLCVAVDSAVPNAETIANILYGAKDLDAVLLSREDILKDLRGGELDLAISPSAGEGPLAGPDDFAPGDSRSRSLCFLYDPERPGGRLARLVVDGVLQEGMGRQDVIRIRDEKVSESGSRYIDFLIPGLIGMNLMASGLWGVGFNVVESRSKKLLKLLAATPMRRSHFLLGYMFSRLIFLSLEVIAIIAFGRLVFGVKVHGSFLSLAAVLLLGALTFAGIGMLVAARPRTIEAVSGWMNFVMLPMWLLSGSFFSYSRFPEIIHPLIRLLPLTALNDTLRHIMNDGGPVLARCPEIGVLLFWGLVSFVVALKIFRWQ